MNVTLLSQFFPGFNLLCFIGPQLLLPYYFAMLYLVLILMSFLASREFSFIFEMCANFFPGRLEIISASTISILAPSMCQQTSVLVFNFIFQSARHCRFFMSVGCMLCCRFVSQKPSSRSPVIFPVFRSTVSAFHLSLLLLCLSLVVYSIYRFLFVFQHSVVVFLSFVLTLSSLLRPSLPFSYSLSIICFILVLLSLAFVP